MSDEREKRLRKKISKLKKEIAEQGRISAFFQAIFNAIPDAAVITDTDRRIIMVNDGVEKIFGFTREEVIGQKTEKFYAGSEDYEEQGRLRYNPDAEENVKPYKIEYRKKNNQVVFSETIGRPVRDENGVIIGYLGLIRDVSELEANRKKLEAADLNYRTVAEFTYDWEYWVDPEGVYRFISPSCERITGYQPAEFMATDGMIREIIVPEDRQIWDKHYDESDKELKLREIRFRIKRKDGEIRWIEHACRPVITGSNKFLGFRVSNRDISERKKAEQELQNALDEIRSLKEQLEAESYYLREEINLEHNFKNIIGNSNAIQYVLFKVEQVAAADTTVLILGETGTGKELIARAIHDTSLRRDRPLVKIDCGALPPNLIESELFGHEKGAFTGAHAKRAGRFEAAEGSTIFLDEIGELPHELQSKLLRVLQDGEFERIGSSRTIKVDVRVIAATNRNLEEDVREGRFRRDLWYRLNVFPLTVPPLRDRTEDIPLLVNHFVERFARKQGKNISTIPSAIIKRLQQYSWPGNIRELENVIERAVVNTTNSKLHLADCLSSPQEKMPQGFVTLKAMERSYIVRVLEKVNWKISGRNSAAEILDIDRSTLRARMKKLGIQKP